ncbi:type II secretion system minor pseudopilin GspJ [Teredinibacter waterburyi]|uniref:type II secretion system minor pseudopilin GspJ n=1 Tax=Teredinibacter waterburyi TaxID=1500538 RepID=UPI00165F4036|nr:type II secretion system minor pseudopilin GspJ [Teredinibacter waterburyi]
MTPIRGQRGISLLEVLIAAVIMATIAVLAFGALDVSQRSAEVSTDKIREIQLLDRSWVLVENDLRNALRYAGINQFGDLMPSMLIDERGEFPFMFIRGGMANPLGNPRTEVMRVAYRVEDEILMRYSWIDPFNVDEDIARVQKILAGVSEFSVTALPDQGATGVKEGPWLDEWPGNGTSSATPDKLPIAVKISFELEGRGELTRLFALLPGD